MSAKFINNNGFIASDDIIVFPCANRGDGISNAKYSQLLTEYNLTHTNGVIGNFDSYVIRNDPTGNDTIKFIAVIGGYLFSIPAGLDASYKYIGIKVTSGVEGTLQPLNGQSGLDVANTFYGAYFSTVALTTSSDGYTYVLDVDNDKSAIARYNSANSQLILN